MRKRLLVAAALLAGLGGVALTTPAQAGDTERRHGCAAHWRNTAAWNECQNADVTVQLQVDCGWPANDDYYGFWIRVRGSISPADRYDCWNSAKSALNAFQ